MLEETAQRLSAELFRREPYSTLTRPYPRPLSPSDYIADLHVLFLAAREGLIRAVSHRDFNVGAVGIIKSLDNLTYTRQIGSNFKLEEGKASLNIHAEDFILYRSRTSYGQILMLVIVGEPQADTGSGLTSPTLHCCGRCRKNFLDNRNLFVEDALIVSIKPDFRTMELASIESLAKFHDSNGKDRSGILLVEHLPQISEEMTKDQEHPQWETFDKEWERRRPYIIAESRPGGKLSFPNGEFS